MQNHAISDRVVPVVVARIVGAEHRSFMCAILNQVDEKMRVGEQTEGELVHAGVGGSVNTRIRAVVAAWVGIYTFKHDDVIKAASLFAQFVSAEGRLTVPSASHGRCGCGGLSGFKFGFES